MRCLSKGQPTKSAAIEAAPAAKPNGEKDTDVVKPGAMSYQQGFATSGSL